MHSFCIGLFAYQLTTVNTMTLCALSIAGLNMYRCTFDDSTYFVFDKSMRISGNIK